VLKDSCYNFYDRYTLSHVDDVYDKIKRDVGSDFGRRNEEKILNFTHFIVIIAATVIYMTLGCLPVVAAKSCMVYWFIAKL
jgi:hypothetical protein